MADTAVTIAKAKVSVMPLPERTAGLTRRFRIDYSDVAFGSTSADTVTVTLGNTPTNWYIDKALVNVNTAFAGTTAFAITVGTTTSSNAILASTSVLTAGTLVNTSGANVVNSVSDCKGTAAKSLVAVFTNSVGGSPSALSAGSLDIFIGLHDPTKLDGPILNQ